MSNNKGSASVKPIFGPREYDVYQRSFANINRLKAQLPEDRVVTLVREVIHRISSKDEMLHTVPIEPSKEELEALTQALISDDDTAAADIINTLRADGTAPETIYLKYLARAARRLGDLWNEDRVSFTRVTIATGRMFSLMRSMRHLFEPRVLTNERAAIFASVPGEDHTMGVRMAADIFRQGGWDIELKIGLDHDALVAEIEKNPRGLVGFSIGGEHSIDALSRLVFAINISCPQSRLFVCGPYVEEARPVLELMGLDGIADDIDDAKIQLAQLWDMRADPSV